ncbi:hypothetical protein HXX76_008067 [Chlamydomonas incerta]|uniref:Uncharacterized protein n=1 Tax=Chlamydomonas incerta TaxID=51695 RepID=A0A835SYB1_CHLIN|nr:hypothetical protein HXX76_008067 [Chlamydomonas incerta]|eukprot:KAG2433697.1 hypothetical protein HXX76_008067 [Chlamydomonas incerta]
MRSAVLSNGETLAFDYAALCTGSSYSDSAFKSTAATSREQRLAEMKALAAAKPGSSPKLGAWKGDALVVVSMGRCGGVCHMWGCLCGGCLAGSHGGTMKLSEFREQLGIV